MFCQYVFFEQRMRIDQHKRCRCFKSNSSFDANDGVSDVDVPAYSNWKACTTLLPRTSLRPLAVANSGLASTSSAALP